ncbi:hypothetical protein [Hansschlegelia zhihuaiae]|uniref:Uncharacterized protein n=1 Tax=Hansschlegelia zhihuaiae TaxID=405005 RepID=A0A4Q0MKL1_9HYPH|nr:hypothetical protein [Hansschlegelia zhihuaiae]RXF74307.1 hypothetical protein EK403_05620 [Hansschlegelia zhihuaiae]
MLDRLKRAASIPLAALILAYDALDAVFGPVVRPVIAALARLRPFQRIGAAIAALPPYGALAVFAVPFAIIEPFKALAVYWMAHHLASGLVALGAAHLGSIFICERIFHVAKPKLLTIGWFARGYGVVVVVRNRALAWARATAAWRAAKAIAVRVRAALRA